jgi:hypothetical protein
LKACFFSDTFSLNDLPAASSLSFLASISLVFSHSPLTLFKVNIASEITNFVVCSKSSAGSNPLVSNDSLIHFASA